MSDTSTDPRQGEQIDDGSPRGEWGEARSVEIDVGPFMVVFELTSLAAPEQYNAYVNAEEIGYIRSRAGVFRCDFTGPTADLESQPATVGEIVLHAMTSLYGLTPIERYGYLHASAFALAARMHRDDSRPDGKNRDEGGE